jgi:hypothetical protein
MLTEREDINVETVTEDDLLFLDAEIAELVERRKQVEAALERWSALVERIERAFEREGITARLTQTKRFADGHYWCAQDGNVICKVGRLEQLANVLDPEGIER